MPSDEISKREREVLDLTGKALMDKEIAHHLGISIRTVEVHQRTIRSKTGCRNRIAVALYAHGIEV